jgi:hypothetical protein
MIEIAYVVGLFNYLTRLADGFGLQVDSWVAEAGRTGEPLRRPAPPARPEAGAVAPAKENSAAPAREVRSFGWFLRLPAAGPSADSPYNFGYLSEMNLLLSAHPRIGPAFWQLFSEIMFAPGALTRAEREMAAAVAAAAQDCHY